MLLTKPAVDWNGITGITKHRGSAGEIKVSERDLSVVIQSKTLTSAIPSTSIFGKGTSGTLFYEIAAVPLEM